jgi:hypothetical protein
MAKILKSLYSVQASAMKKINKFLVCNWNVREDKKKKHKTVQNSDGNRSLVQ